MTDSAWQLGERFETPWGTVAWDARGDGPPLVLAHGTPWASFHWRQVIAPLGNQYRVYWYDLVGYGQSEMTPGRDVSLGVQNRVLCALLDHWGLAAPRIVGHDFGGATVLRARLLDARRFSRLVLVDPVALSPWGSPFFRHVRAHEAAFAGLPANLHRALVAEYVAGASHRGLSPEALAGTLAPWVTPAGQAAFYRQIAQADTRYTDEIEDRLETLTEPVEIVWGEADTWLPLERGEALAARLPHATLHRVPGAGHLVQEDQPAALAALLGTLLADEAF